MLKITKEIKFIFCAILLIIWTYLSLYVYVMVSDETCIGRDIGPENAKGSLVIYNAKSILLNKKIYGAKNHYRLDAFWVRGNEQRDKAKVLEIDFLPSNPNNGLSVLDNWEDNVVWGEDGKSFHIIWDGWTFDVRAPQPLFTPHPEAPTQNEPEPNEEGKQ